ncbi:DUF3291 domain-containing protein [Flagellimonas sp.]|uniref:DUF3291 domain-containing protein n=1 Tax=Flagellimonas sp. TaxID=2058762 RepID=UPI003B58E935
MFFSLSMKAMRVVHQIKGSSCIGLKKRGFWTEHYTMTLWPNKEEMNKFSRSGNHLAAVKKTSSIAKEVRTLTIDANEFPKWGVAKTLLKEKGKILKYE